VAEHYLTVLSSSFCRLRKLQEKRGEHREYHQSTELI
jgi:hypothetical protein